MVTVVIGLTVLYVLALVAAFGFVVPQIWRNAVGHPASLRDYLELAWLTYSLAMIGAPWARRWNPMRQAYVERSDEEAAIQETP